MSQSKLYVGNIPFSATEEGLQAAFAAHGTVTSVHIVTERETGRSRGFAFVEMSTPDEAKAAMEALNDQEFEGRRLRVDLARPRDDRGPRSGGSRRGEGWSSGRGGRRDDRW